MLRGIKRSAAAVAVFVAAPALAEVPAQPTFTKDILPILQENCQDCHHQGTVGTSGLVAPMSLMDYKEVRPWAKAIVKATGSRYMPPWFATKEFHGVFQNERSLTEDQIATLAKWVDTGAPRGNEADAPAARVFEDKEWWIGEPDLIVEMPEPVWIGDDVADWQPNINIALSEAQLPTDRWIRAVECQPGSEVVHHVVLYTTGGESDAFGGAQIGGLAPGAEPRLVQDGYGIKLAKGATVRANMHYHKETGPGTGTWDQSRLGFFFYPEGHEVTAVNIEPIGNMDFEIPPHQENWTVGMARTFERDFTVLNYLPHMHLRGTSAEYIAYYPDGKQETLLSVPEYDYNWQLFYEYPAPRTFPAGTRIEVKMKFNNSTKNEDNPDPNKAIRFGIETTAEMALGWMYYSWADEAKASGASD